MNSIVLSRVLSGLNFMPIKLMVTREALTSIEHPIALDAYQHNGGRKITSS